MEYMTVKEAAKLWKVSESTVRKWCRDGQLVLMIRAQKVSNRWRIPKGVECPKRKEKKENKVS